MPLPKASSAAQKPKTVRHIGIAHSNVKPFIHVKNKNNHKFVTVGSVTAMKKNRWFAVIDTVINNIKNIEDFASLDSDSLFFRFNLKNRSLSVD